METRHTTASKAEENLASYEAKKEAKQQEREEKKDRKHMATNLSTQLLLKNVPPIEHFSGENSQDPVSWLEDIEAIFDATKTEPVDRRRLLPLHLADEAKKWYRSATFDDDYASFKIQLIKAFTSPLYKLQLSSKLTSRRQGLDESVQAYYYDVLDLCHRFNPNMEEDEKVVHILRGLKPSIQQHMAVNDCRTCQDLLIQARQTEAMVKLVHQDTPSTGDAEVEITAALRRTMPISSNRERFSTNNYRGQPSSSGNWSRGDQTYAPRRSQTRGSARCYTCSGYGHFSYQCPNHLN